MASLYAHKKDRSNLFRAPEPRVIATIMIANRTFVKVVMTEKKILQILTIDKAKGSHKKCTALVVLPLRPLGPP